MAGDERGSTLDFDRLAAWMDEQGLPGAGAPLEHEFIAGGSQNEIYELKRGDLHCVIRIPPSFAPTEQPTEIAQATPSAAVTPTGVGEVFGPPEPTPSAVPTVTALPTDSAH